MSDDYDPGAGSDELPTISDSSANPEAVKIWRSLYTLAEALRDVPYTIDIIDEPNTGYVLPVRLKAKSAGMTFSEFKQCWVHFVDYMDNTNSLLLPDGVDPNIQRDSYGFYVTDTITFYPRLEDGDEDQLIE